MGIHRAPCPRRGGGRPRKGGSGVDRPLVVGLGVAARSPPRNAEAVWRGTPALHRTRSENTDQRDGRAARNSQRPPTCAQCERTRRPMRRPSAHPTFVAAFRPVTVSNSWRACDTPQPIRPPADTAQDFATDSSDGVLQGQPLCHTSLRRSASHQHCPPTSARDFPTACVGCVGICSRVGDRAVFVSPVSAGVSLGMMHLCRLGCRRR